ncbi:carboxypeptidase regulatory-like domain-containing protein [Natrinema sp. 74]|uniref:carboxypeptidase regulatory-like domain-containing protein n=1 Tax=Natrinema sp. 74 TaxID=3384159 RepID=UPI0038D4A29C
MQHTRRLRIDTQPHEAAVGEAIAVRVRDDRRRPVEGAVIETGTKIARTDERGLCRFDFRSPGFWKLVAAKSPTDRVAYAPASTLVRIVPSPSRRRPHRLEKSR